MAGEFEFVEEQPAAAPSGGGAFEFIEEPARVQRLPGIDVGKTPEQIRMMRGRTPEQQRAVDEAQAKETYEKMLLSGRSPAEKGALSFLGSYGQAFAPGVFEWAPAAGAKLLGKVGVPGYESYAEQPVEDIRQKAKGIIGGAQAEYPKTSAAGTVTGLGAGVAALPAVTKLPVVGELGTVGSGAATGALYDGLSEGAEKGDLGSALRASIMGGGLGATLAPVAEKAISGLTTLVKGGRPVVDAQGNLTQEAIDIAQKAGLTPEQINYFAPSLVQTFEKRGLTEAAAREAPFAEFGIEPKRGMVSLEPKQLAREEKFGEYEPIAAQATAEAERAFGAPVPLRDAVEQAVAKGQSEAAKLKSDYEQAYKTAASVPGKFSRETLTSVGDKLLGNLAKDEKALAFRNSDVVQSAAKKLNETLGQALPTGPEVGAPRIVHQTFGAVEEARKTLNQAFGAAKDKTDRAGVRRLINDFDQYVEDSISNGAFSGDKNVVQQWRDARKLFSKYQDKYGVKKTGEESGMLLKQIMDGTKSPEDVGNMMFNFASTGEAKAKASALKTYFQLQRALGPNAPELQQVTRSFLQQLVTPTIKAGEAVSPKTFTATANQIDNFLSGNQASFARRLLAPDDIKYLKEYANVMRAAGTKAPKDVQPTLGAFGQAAAASAPLVLEAIAAALGHIHPGWAALIAAPTALSSRFSAVKGSEWLARRAANLAPESVGRPYETPGIRTGIPLLEQAALRDQERQPRATGGKTGRVYTAEQMLSRSKVARKAIGDQTKSILEQPDERVVSALKAVSDHI